VQRLSRSQRRAGRPAGLAALALLAGSLAGIAPAAGQSGAVAFVGANVIPMDGDRVLAGQTVVVRDGRIAALGPDARTEVPAGATRIDARGKYLIPGLAEMHGHVPAVGAAGPRFAEDVLFLYVAAGATTVRGMQGHPSQLELRRRVQSGDLIGPRLFLSSPPLSGNNVADAATAERLVREHKAAGYDLLKVHEGLSKEAYAAIARTAREVGLPFGGHVSDIVGLEGALAERQSTIDHVDNYVLAMLPGNAAALASNADAARIPALARATREAGVAVVPTMALWEVILGRHDPAAMKDRAELRYMPAAMVQNWVTQVGSRRAQVDPAEAAREVELRRLMLKELSDAGVRILMGTDAPQLFSVPGFSLDRELVSMAGAGMTPYQILRSGTVAVAEHLGLAAESGTIAVGKRADLVLLDANPLADIANVQKRAGVMVNGRWLGAAEIGERLGAIAGRNAAR